MSAFYDGLAQTALVLLQDKGMTMTLNQRTPGTYSATTGTTTVTETTYTVTGAQFHFPANMIDGSMIQRGDRRVIVAARGMTVEPDAGDVLTIAGTRTNVVAVKAINPGGTTIAYVLQVRR